MNRWSHLVKGFFPETRGFFPRRGQEWSGVEWNSIVHVSKVHSLSSEIVPAVGKKVYLPAADEAVATLTGRSWKDDEAGREDRTVKVPPLKLQRGDAPGWVSNWWWQSQPGHR